MNTRIVRLGSVCTVISGSTPKSDVAEYWDGDVKWITPAELTEDSYIITDSVRHITSQAVQDTSLKPFPEGTVILSSRAPIGKTAIAGCEMYCNQGFKNLICSPQIDPKYLYCFLSGKTEFLNSLGRGATFKEISKSIVENIEIPLPELSVQKRISLQFEHIRTLIRQYREQLHFLDQLVKSRFIEMFGDLANPACVWPQAKLVETCADPDDIKCGPFGTQLSKDEYRNEGIALWEIPQINSQFKAKPTHYLDSDKAFELDAYSIKPGDIAMSRKGNVGRCAVFPCDYSPGIIHSDVLRIRVDTGKVSPVFMMYQLHYSGGVQRQIEQVSSGAIMAGINVTKLKSITVHLPPLDLQEQYAAFIAQTDKSKFSLKNGGKEADFAVKCIWESLCRGTLT